MCLSGCEAELEQKKTEVLEISADLIEEAEDTCNPPVGWSEIYRSNTDGFYIFGEMHGTVEVPKAVAEFACAIAVASKEPVHVVYELTEYIPNLDTKNVKRSNVSQRQHIIDAVPDFWLFDSKDGRRTEAILESVFSVIDYGNDGLSLTAGSMGFTYEQSGQIRSKALTKRQAESHNLKEMISKYPRVILLSGNWHALRYAGIVEAEKLGKFIAIDHAHGDGFGTNCMDVCGENSLGEHHVFNKISITNDVGLSLYPESDEVFKAYLKVKNPTASPIIIENRAAKAND